MIYNSVADIFATNDEIRGRLVARAAALSAAQQNYRRDDGAWTPAEIVEHLALIERRMVQLLSMMLKKTESAMAAAGAPAAAGSGARPMQPLSLAEFAERARTEKFVAPEEVRPRGGISLADSLAGLRETRAAIQELRPRLEAVDGTLAQYPHPAFGPLNLYQWLAFIGVHEARHLRQIERLMTPPAEARAEG